MRQVLMTPNEEEALGHYLRYWPEGLNYDQVLNLLERQEHLPKRERGVFLHEEVEGLGSEYTIQAIENKLEVLNFRAKLKR